MPKKRKTRAAPSRKAVAGIGEAKAEEEKQNKDDRAEAIAVLKQDFEQELQAREKKLAKELVDMTKSFKAAHRTMLISLPSFIQKMTIKEFLAYGGNVEDAAKAAVESSVAESAATTQKSPPATVVGVSRVPLTEVVNHLEPPDLMPPPSMPCPDGAALALETPAEIVKTRAKRKATQTATTTARTTRSTRRTRQAEIDIGDTPAPTAPTPMFDPRLPGLKANAGGTGRARPKTRREPTVTIDRSNREEYLTVLEDIADILPQEKIGDSDASIVDAYRKLHQRLTVALAPMELK